MSAKKEAELVKLRPKLAQALIGKEIGMRTQLRKARAAQDLEAWQVAESLGWRLQKVLDIESQSRDIKQSDIRKYLLAINCFIDYQVKSEKALG